MRYWEERRTRNSASLALGPRPHPTETELFEASLERNVPNSCAVFYYYVHEVVTASLVGRCYW